MKRYVGLLLMILLLATSAMPMKAAGSVIGVQVNGRNVAFDMAPVKEKGTVLVPLLPLLEALGAEWSWNEYTGSFGFAKGDTQVYHKIGTVHALVNQQEKTLSSPGKYIGDTAFVPVRLVSETLGAEVKWDGRTQIVRIRYSNEREVRILGVMDGFYVRIGYEDKEGTAVEEIVRLSGIAPIRSGMDATSYVRSQLPDGAKVRMETRGARDRNRHLRVILRSTDGKSLNEKFVSAGYAVRSRDLMDKALDAAYAALERQAREAKAGLWSKDFSGNPFGSVRKAAVHSGNAAVITEKHELWVWGQFYEKPTRILDRVVDVQLDSDSGLILKSDGTVWAWGYDVQGLWHTDEPGPTVMIEPRQVAGLKDIAAIANGHVSAMAVGKNGQVCAWGSSLGAKLGHEYRLSLHMVSKPTLTGWEDVAAVSPAHDFTVVLKRDGTVWQTQPESGKLLRVDKLERISAISVNNNFALALKDDGTVWTWGKKSVFGPYNPSNAVPERVAGLEKIRSIDAGYDHAVAIDQEGRPFVWGVNGYAQLGVGEASEFEEEPRLVKSLPRVRSAAAGHGQSLFLHEDGSLWGTGRSPHFLFGDDLKSNGYAENVKYHELVKLNWQP